MSVIFTKTVVAAELDSSLKKKRIRDWFHQLIKHVFVIYLFSCVALYLLIYI